jgi:hypothetical protein
MKWRHTACLLLLQAALQGHSALAQVPDFAGTWLPVPAMSTPWDAATLPLTDLARERLAAFDPRRHDSTYFCMPFGTPRNILNTAERPLKVLQGETQLTLLFDGLGDVRRVFLDGRPQPEDPVPGWMGASIGRWEGSTLHVETIALTGESILSEAGLPHGESLRVEEELRLVEANGEQLLQVDLSLTDPEFYTGTLTARRWFRRAPDAIPSEGSAHCLMDQWRRRLEDYNRGLYRDLQAERGELQP